MLNYSSTGPAQRHPIIYSGSDCCEKRKLSAACHQKQSAYVNAVWEIF